MIGSAVAFQAKNVIARFVGMYDSDIDAILGNANLRVGIVSGGIKP